MGAMKLIVGGWFSVAFVAACLGSFPAVAANDDTVVKLESPLGPQGSVSILVETDGEYRNGPDAKSVTVDILTIPGLAKLHFSQSSTVCELQWIWTEEGKAENLAVEIPALPGPEEYFIQYTWDALKGRFTGYVNGTALRLPETQLPTWDAAVGREVHCVKGSFKTKLVSSEARFLDEAQARAQVPEALLAKRAELFGDRDKEHIAVDLSTRRGELLYASALDTPDSVEGWVMEGPGLTDFKDGWMAMASQHPDGMSKNGHSVYWCPRDFPDSFVAEWDMQINSEYGLCIVFFAARGLQGEDLFDRALPKRDGAFKQYNQGAISCYHISYFANAPNSPGRITSNMRKNSGFYLVSNGPPGIEPGSNVVHVVRLIKDASHIQLLVDEKVIVDFTDDGKRYGPVLGGGKIGLRQMQWTKALYRNLRVYELR